MLVAEVLTITNTSALPQIYIIPQILYYLNFGASLLKSNLVQKTSSFENIKINFGCPILILKKKLNLT